MNKIALSLFPLLLCVGCVDTADPADGTVSQADTIPSPDNPVDACHHMANGGAQVLGDATHPVNIYNLYWGTAFWNETGFGGGAMWRDQIDTAWRFLGNDHAYFNAVQQYGTGTGRFAGSLVTGNPPATVNNDDIQNFVTSVTSKYTLTGIAPTVNDVYVVYLPNGVVSTGDIGLGGHHWFFYHPEDGRRVVGATIPWAGGDSVSINIDRFTTYASHELFEAMAHPISTEAGWREVGDPCETLPAWSLDGYDVPRIYSNRSCGCVTSEGVGAGLKDFNGDGLSDILWQNSSTGAVAFWSIGRDSKVASAATLNWTANTPWLGVGVADFNGDHKPDVLWHNPSSGEVGIWLVNGTTVTRGFDLEWNVPGTTWQVRGTGDFNGDGSADILWHNATTGQLSVWYLSGGHIIGSAALSRTSVGTANSVMGTGDFDGDGNVDVLWHNPTTGVVSVWLMRGTTVRSIESLDGSYAGTDWKLMGTEDFDDDGLIDLAWHNTTTGEVGIWYLSGMKVRDYVNVDWTAAPPWRVISR